MSKERVSREVKLERKEKDWFYCRSGFDERLTSSPTIKPTVLFDEETVIKPWIYDVFRINRK